MKKNLRYYLILLLMMIVLLLCACGTQTSSLEKIRNLSFTVVSEERLPEELVQIVQEKKQGTFKTTYTDKDYLYICIGYGEQKTGGYSIAVNELYEAENAIYIDTNLIGPELEEVKKEGLSYPYIVVKTEFLDKNVVFP